MSRKHRVSVADLAHVGKGTPAGEWLRRYWLAVGVAAELRDIPQAVKVLGEDLVLFRDGQGRAGLLGLHCPHRGTSLEYGDVEPAGIRCAYHGWLFDVRGQCLEQPAEPKGSTFCQRVRHLSYPLRELGGLLFAYLGPDQEDPPPLPRYSVLVDRGEQRQIEPVRHFDFNWFNQMENSADPAHVWILHRYSGYGAGTWGSAFFDYHDPPSFDVVEADYGLRTTWRKPGPSPAAEMVDVMSLALPGIIQLGDTALIHLPGDEAASAWETYQLEHVLFITPNDDEHFMVFTVDAYQGNDPQFFQKLKQSRAREVPPAEVKPYDRRQYVPFRGSVRDEDNMVLMTQGPPNQRSERLGSSDRGVILLRKIVRDAIEAVLAGERPKGVVSREQAEMIVELDSFVGLRPTGQALVATP
jgi:phenylpropionate dioxygenase-like ring-hydroxylating dioxygenase large terminal subunit